MEFKKALKSKFAGVIIYLLGIQFLALSLMSLFRFVFFYTGYENVKMIDNKWKWIFDSFFLSLRYDNIVASYILIPALILLPILSLFKIYNRRVFILSNIYFIITYGIVFLISCMDIPYFHYFFRHINASVLNWAEYGKETAGMVLTESSYIPYISLFFGSILLFGLGSILLSRKLLRSFTEDVDRRSLKWCVFVLFFLYLMCFIGTRGRLRRLEPLKVDNAYFSDSSFINQMTINPFFFLWQSFAYVSTYEKSLMDEDTALDIASNKLGFDIRNGAYLKENQIITTPCSVNVVVIIVESFSNDYLTIQRNNKPIMPYLSNLINESAYYFDNFYSQGSHTNQGIMSTLCGFPSLFERQMLRTVDIANFTRAVLPSQIMDDMQQENKIQSPIYKGLASDLQGRGYQTTFFLTHDSNYDNTGSFLKANGIDKVYSLRDYPPDEVKNIWGVSDEFLFKYAITQMDETYRTDKPFFAGLMTISNHPPYSYTDEFKTISKNEDERAIAYTDWCIKNFMTEASKKDWYNNTIFLILGDHGKVIGTSKYDMPLSLNHIPLIITSSLFKDEAKRMHIPGGQIDVYKTVMGLLNQECRFKSFGVDLFSSDRKEIIFTSDEKMGCLSEKYFYVKDVFSGKSSFYNLDFSNDKIEEQRVIDSMSVYSAAIVESAKYILKNQLSNRK